MNEIIATINDKNKLEDNVQAFSQLLKENKLETLEKLKIERTEIVGQFLNRVYAQNTTSKFRRLSRSFSFASRQSALR